MHFTRSRKLVIGNTCLVIVLLAVAGYFASDWYYDKIELGANMDMPVTVVTPRVPAEILSRLPPGANTYRKSDANLQSSDLSELSTNHLDDTNVRDDWNLGEDDDFPEHLKCPEKWVGVYLADLSESELFEVVAHADAVAKEIVQNHNPNRPLSEIWPRFIAAEKELISQSEAVLSDLQPKFAAGRRIDRLYDQARRFPEIQALRLKEGKDGRWAQMYLVDIGHSDPDWNLVKLPDGRDFRVKYGRRYTFHTTKVTQGNTTSGGSFTICLSDPETAENIVIDNYEKVSNTELGKLGGWNYNHNPYTAEQ